MHVATHPGKASAHTKTHSTHVRKNAIERLRPRTYACRCVCMFPCLLRCLLSTSTCIHMHVFAQHKVPCTCTHTQAPEGQPKGGAAGLPSLPRSHDTHMPIWSSRLPTLNPCLYRRHLKVILLELRSDHQHPGNVCCAKACAQQSRASTCTHARNLMHAHAHTQTHTYTHIHTKQQGTCFRWQTWRCIPPSLSWSLPVMIRRGRCGTCQQEI
jgi:hypothetical protein